MYNRKHIQNALIQLGYSIFLCLFGAVYELFSHDVYSYYMLYAFLFPLLMGVLPNIILIYCKKSSSLLSSILWKWSIYTLSIGSIVQGILEIYGTTNQLTMLYWLVGIGMALISMIIFLIKKFK